MPSSRRVYKPLMIAMKCLSGSQQILPPKHLQLYDTDKEVAIEAADILDEACDEESFLKALVLQQPQLLHLGEKGASIQTRFFSVKRGFALMARLGYLDWLQQKWKEVCDWSGIAFM